MTNQQLPLPAYEDPPVSEVALSVQFQSLPTFNAVHGGLLWSRFRERFPGVEQHAPLEHTIERTGARSTSLKVAVTFVSGSDISPRLWMLNEGSTELIQVQADRFIRNWRRAGPSKVPYPRYQSHLRPAFLRDFAEFQSFVEVEGLAPIVFDQCEITYVNHIFANSVWRGPEELEKVFTGWSAEYRNRMRHEIEGVGIRTRQALKGASGEFLGRLLVEIDTGSVPDIEGVDSEGQRVLVMKLIARGHPFSSDLEGVMKFMDLGHAEIVSTFDRMTSEQMHAVWRKIQ